MDQSLQPETISEPQETVTDKAEVSGESLETEEEILIPVKFNKEVKNLTAAQAAELAQKGMKFEMISSDFNRLKELAKRQNLSVGAYVERLEKDLFEARKAQLMQKCGGDEELAAHIMELEQGKAGEDIYGFDELKEYFPEVERLSDLPDEVVESASIRGRSVLDEYLRYKLRCERASANAMAQMKAAGRASVGSQRQATAKENAVNSEFLRGLWGK